MNCEQVFTPAEKSAMATRHRVTASATLMDRVPRKRIAVVGSGVAGLSTAYLLSRTHEVHIFEREATVGMDAHSLCAHGARMDIPLRVFSASYYPNLCNLYNLVGIKYAMADYSFSCRGSKSSSSPAAYFRYLNIFVNGMALPIPACYNPLQLIKCLRLGYNVRARSATCRLATHMLSLSN